MAAPRHVLLELDEQGDLHSVGEESDAEELGEGRNAFDQTCIDLQLESAPEVLRAAMARGRTAASTNDPSLLSGFPFQGSGDCAVRTATSRFWGVYWDTANKQWKAQYTDADGKTRHVGTFDNEEEAARARDQAVRKAGLEGRRRMNAVDATAALVPKRSGAPNRLDQDRGDRSAVVAPDPARAPAETSSKYWGVSWDRLARQWSAYYSDANGKYRSIGRYDTQEAAAHAVNAAIRGLPPDVQARRKTNPVVDDQLVPKPSRKRSRAEVPAAARTLRSARRSRQE